MTIRVFYNSYRASKRSYVFEDIECKTYEVSEGLLILTVHNGTVYLPLMNIKSFEVCEEPNE